MDYFFAFKSGLVVESKQKIDIIISEILNELGATSNLEKMEVMHMSKKDFLISSLVLFILLLIALLFVILK